MYARKTLRDVAAECGVSIATASRGLRGDGRVSQATRELLKATAERLGYKPEPLLARLASRRFHTDLTLSGTTFLLISAHLNSPRSAADHGEFQRAAEALGYRYEHFGLPMNPDYNRLEREWFHRGVRGLAFKALYRAQDVLSRRWDRFAVVSFSASVQQLLYHQVQPHTAAAIFSMADEAVRRGYKRIGFSVCPHDIRIPDDDEREGAARVLAQRFESEIPVLTGPLRDPEPFLAWYRKWKPDAIVCFPPLHLYWLTSSGIRVPEDVAVMTTPVHPGADPSGWVEDIGAVSTAGVALMDSMLRHGELGPPAAPSLTLIRGSWNEGKTAPSRI